MKKSLKQAGTALCKRLWRDVPKLSIGARRKNKHPGALDCKTNVAIYSTSLMEDIHFA